MTAGASQASLNIGLPLIAVALGRRAFRFLGLLVDFHQVACLVGVRAPQAAPQRLGGLPVDPPAQLHEALMSISCL
jgi:hypothetical protein